MTHGIRVAVTRIADQKEERDMPIQPGDYKKWAGAGVVSIVSDYADARMHRFISSLSNGEVLQIGTLALQVFTSPSGRYRDYYDGGADYAAGNLLRRILGSRLVPSTTTTTPTTTTTHVVSHSTASTPGGSSSGLAGVPASGGSAVFDQTTPGF